MSRLRYGIDQVIERQVDLPRDARFALVTSDAAVTRFVPPSPGIPSYNSALFYPGTCLFEATTELRGFHGTTPVHQIVCCRRAHERDSPFGGAAR
jgi:uncharacterized protein YbbC (DUF1343 family)